MIALALDLLSGALVLVGAGFFMAGTVGLLRFPDVYCRLHALTKADNLGLGFVLLGLAIRTPGVATRLHFLLLWLLALAAAATVCHLLARSSLEAGVVAVEGGREKDPT
jgi:multicomponent Na+:H+ antiporter subunit G